MSRPALTAHVLKRTIVIFALGLLLNGFPHYNLYAIRIPGVLQRIAICYCAGALFFIWTNLTVQMMAIIGLLSGYGWLMSHGAAPGFPPGDLSPAGNLVAFIDRTLLRGHLYRPVYDPEGLLSTLPAIATGLLGNMTGFWTRSREKPSAA